MTEWKTKCTERDSVTDSASPACLGPEGLPTPRRSFVCFRLGARCETDSRGTGGGAQADRKAEKRSQRESPRSPPHGSSKRIGAAANGKRNDRTPAVSSTLPAYRCLERRLYPCKASTYCGWRSVQGGSYGTGTRGASTPRRKTATSGKSVQLVSVSSLRAILEPAWSGVRAAEGARLEIAWAGSTRLEGSNPSHSASIPGRSPAYSSAGERPLHTREVLGSIPSTPIPGKRITKTFATAEQSESSETTPSAAGSERSLLSAAQAGPGWRGLDVKAVRIACVDHCLRAETAMPLARARRPAPVSYRRATSPTGAITLNRLAPELQRIHVGKARPRPLRVPSGTPARRRRPWCPRSCRGAGGGGGGQSDGPQGAKR